MSSGLSRLLHLVEIRGDQISDIEAMSDLVKAMSVQLDDSDHQISRHGASEIHKESMGRNAPVQ